MTISIRLNDETETELRQRLRYMGIPLSEFVREAIREKLTRETGKETPFELGKDLFGRHSSRDTNRSTQRKELVRKRLHEKHYR